MERRSWHGTEVLHCVSGSTNTLAISLFSNKNQLFLGAVNQSKLQAVGLLGYVQGAIAHTLNAHEYNIHHGHSSFSINEGLESCHKRLIFINIVVNPWRLCYFSQPSRIPVKVPVVNLFDTFDWT